MERYRCKICGYVYEPILGVPEDKIPPPLDFKDLPNSWNCPVCGADKTKFEIFKEES